MDTRTPQQRRFIMQSVKNKNTGPELVVRKELSRLGYRYRLHKKDLPGKPDIALINRKTAIFVQGCFWHGHKCRKGRLPKSRLEYWQPKIERNVQRDKDKALELKRMGWKVLKIWECELKAPGKLRSKLIDRIPHVDRS